MLPPPADADEAFAWIEGFTNLERGGYQPREYRLERMERLLRDFDDPHIGPATVHIAGSKGKGSTACFVEAGLRACGHRTGLYASPHVSDYRERFLIDGHFAHDNDILAETVRIHTYVEPLRRKKDAAALLPTTFELLTLLAFLLFRRAACDWIVLETGLGGRLDATNLCRPDMCLITPIELEHTEYLGDTHALIAREKAGIFKRGVPAITAPQHPDADEALADVAEKRGVRLRRLNDEVALEDIRVDRSGTHARIALKNSPVRPLRDSSRESANRESAHDDSRRKDVPENEVPADYRLQLRLLGEAQTENAALALLALQTLLPDTNPHIFLHGFTGATLPGRSEIFREAPPILLDGAHTPESMRKLMRTVATLLPRPRIVLFGAVTGKAVEAMAHEIEPLADAAIVSTPGTFKPSDPPRVTEIFRQHNIPVELVPAADEALARARNRATPDGSIIVTGSFFMVCEIRAILLGDDKR